MSRVFISHPGENEAIAREIARSLEASGYTTWYYERDCLPGVSHLRQTSQAIEETRAFLLLVSQASLASDEVDSEVNWAHNYRKPFFPILLDLTWEDFEQKDFEQRQRTWRRIIGNAVGISLYPAGVAGVIPRVVAGLMTLRIPPTNLPLLSNTLRDMVIHNREQELDTLRDHMRTSQVTFITGMGGIGKTTLARVLVDMRPADVPLPMWIDFAPASTNTLGKLLEKFADYLDWPELGIRPSGGDSQPGPDDVKRLTDRLSRSAPRWLIFDNFEQALDENCRFCDAGVESLFQALLTDQQQARLIICSRILPDLRDLSAAEVALGMGTVALDGLSPSNGINLLRKSRIREASDDQLEELVQRADGHPLVLWMLSEEAKAPGVEELLKDDTLWKASNAWEFTHQLFLRLPEAEQQLIKRFSVFRTPQTTSVLAALAGGGRPGIEAHRRVIERSLLTVQPRSVSGAPGLYTLHPMIREVAESELKADERVQAHLQAYQTYLPDPLPSASRRPDLDTNVTARLEEAHYHALQAGEITWAIAILLEYGLPDHLEQRGKQDRLIKLCRETFGAISDSESYPNYLNKTGYARLTQEDVNAAERARLYRQLGKCARYRSNDCQRALACYEQGLELLGEETDQRELARLYRDSAFVLQHLGDSDQALARCRRGLALIQNVDDRQGLIDKATLHMRAGVILLGQAEESQTDKPEQSETLLEEARIHFEQTRNIYEQLEMSAGSEYEKRTMKARAYEAEDNLGLVRSVQGQYEEALAMFTKVHEYYEKIGYSVGDGHARLNMGDALNHLGRYPEARPLLESAQKWFMEISDQLGQLLSLYDLGELMIATREYEAALEPLNEALRIAQETGDETNRADILNLLGKAYKRLLRMEDAHKHLKDAIIAAGKSNNKKALSTASDLLKELELR